jgi:hypothetical protein
MLGLKASPGRITAKACPQQSQPESLRQRKRERKTHARLQACVKGALINEDHRPSQTHTNPSTHADGVGRGQEALALPLRHLRRAKPRNAAEWERNILRRAHFQFYIKAVECEKGKQ